MILKSVQAPSTSRLWAITERTSTPMEKDSTIAAESWL